MNPEWFSTCHTLLSCLPKTLTFLVVDWCGFQGKQLWFAPVHDAHILARLNDHEVAVFDFRDRHLQVFSLLTRQITNAPIQTTTPPGQLPLLHREGILLLPPTLEAWLYDGAVFREVAHACVALLDGRFLVKDSRRDSSIVDLQTGAVFKLTSAVTASAAIALALSRKRLLVYCNGTYAVLHAWDSLQPYVVLTTNNSGCFSWQHDPKTDRLYCAQRYPSCIHGWDLRSCTLLWTLPLPDIKGLALHWLFRRDVFAEALFSGGRCFSRTGDIRM